MENLILKKETLDLLEKVYINNLESVLIGEGNKDPKGILKRLDTSIKIVEFIGTLSGYFGKLKTDKIELIIKNPQIEKGIDELIESVKKGEILDPELSEIDFSE